VQDRSASGDTQLDAALASLVDTRYPPGPVTWIGLPRRGILGAYLSRLTSAGVLSEAASRLLGTPRYRVTAPERVAQARSRLDAVARSAGEPAELADTVLGALVSAIGLDGELYPGSAGRPPRASLARLARGQWTPRTMLAEGTRDPAALEASALEASVLAAVRAATCAVVQAVHNVGPHSDGPRPDATDETNRWGRSADTII
jgi:hypothetical protein